MKGKDDLLTLVRKVKGEDAFIPPARASAAC
jgi:hypothetical protein